MSEFSTSFNVSGRVGFNSKASASVSRQLAEKLRPGSNARYRGVVQQTKERNCIIVVDGASDQTLTLNVSDSIAPRSVMPGDNVTIHIRVDAMDSSGIGELRGGTIAIVVDK